MSYDPQRPNPYQPPSGYGQGEPPPFHPTPSAADNPLVIPASILLALAGLWFLVILASLPNQFANMEKIDTSTPEGQGEITGMIIALIVWPLMMLVVIFGSISMLRLRGYSAAMTGAIAAVIPCCSPWFVVGIPLAIWALVLLRRPDVIARFR